MEYKKHPRKSNLISVFSALGAGAMSIILFGIYFGAKREELQNIGLQVIIWIVIIFIPFLIGISIYYQVVAKRNSQRKTFVLILVIVSALFSSWYYILLAPYCIINLFSVE